ncbi:unnamed protein product [Soboliphyme baturini]|uniref:MARVEL domain-containing protein n=1 Tax=Soboliphyme baturini TaxID=241478 RepID=A0A183IEF5_9BILA|nr:unnamed protein product [Soboliphyme baturini]
MHGSGTYIDPLGSHCRNIQDYQIPEDAKVVSSYSYPQRTRMHLMRACVAFYIVGLGFLFICLFTGISGCWRRSAMLILVTGILLLFSTLFLAGSIAVWHGVDYLQKEVIGIDASFESIRKLINDNTMIGYGWSYMISWIGIGFILISSILMLAAYRAIREEERDEYDKKRMPYIMPNYYDKTAMMPYTYANYGYPYPTYGYSGAYGPPGNSYYGYLTYAR